MAAVWKSHFTRVPPSLLIDFGEKIKKTLRFQPKLHRLKRTKKEKHWWRFQPDPTITNKMAADLSQENATTRLLGRKTYILQKSFTVSLSVSDIRLNVRVSGIRLKVKDSFRVTDQKCRNGETRKRLFYRFSVSTSIESQPLWNRY